MIQKIAFFLFLFLPIAIITKSQDITERRKQHLEDLLKIIIPQRFSPNTRKVTDKDSTWKEWLARTGELPPDFSNMRSSPFLPDPLISYTKDRHIPITTMTQWEEKRKWIKKEYQHWISGYFPPAPDNIRSEIISEKIEEGCLVQFIRLRFGPEHKAEMNFELMIPIQSKKPLPVYMTQWNHRGWAQLAVRRGYIGCVYAAADTYDDTEGYRSVYPEYDFSMLMRRAWGASRVIDYLYSRKEIDKNKIAITGHSRNGKQSLWAAAFDDRITAVISSSSSTGGESPWRYNDPQYASETIDLVTAYNGHWFHPRLRFFFGNEDKLPVDQNLLAALIAPRALLFHYSIHEIGLNSWSIEQNYNSVKKVYDFYKASDKIGVSPRMGRHAVSSRDIDKTIDFLDIHFNRRDIKWNNILYYPYDYNKWLNNNQRLVNESKKIQPVILKNDYVDVSSFERDRTRINDNLKWLLGNRPPGVKAKNVAELPGNRAEWIRLGVLNTPTVKGAKATELGPYDAPGDNLRAVLYTPEKYSSGKTKLPVVVYLHQYAHSSGFIKGYDKNNQISKQKLFTELIKKGFAVLALDMFGFGTRIEEATDFYGRFPTWSKMDKMIMDVSHCIDALHTIDSIDKKNIFLFGNSIGGSVALMSAALDDRIAGVGIVAAISPLRTSNNQFESLKTYSHLFGLMPKMGLYAEHPQKAPIDFGEIIASVVPKPVMIIAPELDWHTDIKSLKAMLEPVKNIYNLYGEREMLDISYPVDINRMPENYMQKLSGFFLKHVKN